jgi:hypothetical protein
LSGGFWQQSDLGFSTHPLVTHAMSPSKLSDHELQILQDQELMITKNRILTKVEELLQNTRTELNEFIRQNGPWDIHWIDGSLTGKISKGEHYEEMPYRILDFPRFIQDKDFVLYRTMVWWGHTISFTLHANGTIVQKIANHIEKNDDCLGGLNGYICINKDPWQHHFRSDNYVLVSGMDRQEISAMIRSNQFVKLSTRIPLEQYMDTAKHSVQFLETLLGILYDRSKH